MRYVLLIYDDERARAERPPDARAKLHDHYTRFTAELIASGVHQAGEALQPTAIARCVRKQGGKVLVTDGPYAETKEALGGFYLVAVPDLAAAQRIAAAIPSTDVGGVIEVRPVVEFAPG